MSNQRGILIFGANGSGKTTLGRELARILGFKRIDHEDYFFEESVIPYTVTCPREMSVKLIPFSIKISSGFAANAREALVVRGSPSEY